MPFELINGNQMYYELHGSGHQNQDVIVLIHGLALDSSTWGDIPALLETHFPLVLYDLRAHGQNGTNKEELTWMILCDDLHQFIKKLGLTRVHLLAFGYGTHLAAKYAQQYPDHVQSLLLLSLPYMSPNNAHSHLARHVFSNMKETMESGHPHFLRQYEDLLKGYTTLASDDPRLMHYFHVLLNYSTSHISHMIELTSNSAMLMELSDLSCPVMILTGELNLISPSGLLNASSFLLKNATHITIPNASFLFFLEQPKETAKWVRLFIMQKCPRLRLGSSSTKQETSQLIQTIFQPAEQNREQRIHFLTIQILQAFHVEIDSIPVTSGWNRRHAKRLLTYLAFHPVTTREVICEALFPHLDAYKALANLRVYLSHLDKLLRHPSVPARGLLFHQGTVSVQYKIKCDLIDLMALIRQAHQEQNPSIRFQLCEQLSDSLSKDILTDHHDDWAVYLRNQIEAQICELNEWMAIYCASQALYSKAAFYYMNLLHYFPDEASIYDSLINMFLESGDHQTMNMWMRKKAAVLQDTKEIE